MANRGILSKNYYIVPGAVADLGAEVYNMMAEADQAMAEASEIIAEIASLTERVPSQIRCGALLEACELAQTEIKSVDFLSYGQKVDQGLQNLLDHNQYITEHFIKNMGTHTEKMRGLGEEFRRLADSIMYSGESLQPKDKKLLKVHNAENENTEGEEESYSNQGWDDVFICMGAEKEIFEIEIDESEIGKKILSNYMEAFGVGNEEEIEDFTNWIIERRPDLLQQLYVSNNSSAEGAGQVLDEIFHEIASAQNNKEDVTAYMEIYDNYKMNMAIEILEEYLAQIEDDNELSNPNNWAKIEEILQRNNPRLLINLYETQGEEGKAGVFAYLMREYKQSVEYIFEHISEEDVYTQDEMHALNTPDLLARMIYAEQINPGNGEQNKVLWATVNRYFSEKNFTNSKEINIRNILLEGGYASIDKITTHQYDGYHPEYDSEGWENAKLLAAILYSQIGDKNSDKVNEDNVRNAILSSCDIYGYKIDNTIGDCDSFYAKRGANGIDYNYFYEMQPYNGG